MDLPPPLPPRRLRWLQRMGGCGRHCTDLVIMIHDEQIIEDEIGLEFKTPLGLGDHQSLVKIVDSNIVVKHRRDHFAVFNKHKT